MKKKKIIALSILAVVVIAVITGIVFIVSYISELGDRVASITISDVDISRLDDGTYNGEYDMFPVSAEVNVTVKNHLITDIELVKHANGQGSAAEVLPCKVIEAQALGVDTITGATYSSKVILKAIEDALTPANNRE